MAEIDPRSRYFREIFDWTKRQAEKERKEEEESQQLSNAQSNAQQMCYNSYISVWRLANLHRPLTYGLISPSAESLGAGGSNWQQQAQAVYGAQNNSMFGMLGPAQSAEAPVHNPHNPHKVLTEKISALSLVEPAKLSVRRLPDYTATLTGWRGWAVKDEKLQALGQSGAWKPRQAKPAKCIRQNSHRAPAKECTCGYWSFFSLEILTKALASYTSEVAVVGSVELWGRVIECENGYRSEFAYPKELWLLKPDLEYLSEGYGVAVRKLDVDEKVRSER